MVTASLVLEGDVPYEIGAENTYTITKRIVDTCSPLRIIPPLVASRFALLLSLLVYILVAFILDAFRHFGNLIRRS